MQSILDVTAQIEGIEWIVLLIIVAVFFLFGPSKIPQMFHALGKGLGMFHKGKAEIERQIRLESDAHSIRCPKCGNLSESVAKHCRECGTELPVSIATAN